MSVFMIILDWLFWIYVVEFLPICRDLETFTMMYIDLMTCIFWKCMTFIRCDCWGILYMHVVWIFVWRCSVYFLNRCFIRVFYRFNRNRALHAASQASRHARCSSRSLLTDACIASLSPLIRSTGSIPVISILGHNTAQQRKKIHTSWFHISFSGLQQSCPEKQNPDCFSKQERKKNEINLHAYGIGTNVQFDVW